MFANERERVSSMKTEVKFKAESFRKIPNPYAKTKEEEAKAQMYVALCDVTQLPCNFPMQTNPREQNLNTGVAKKIKNSLIEEGSLDFFLLNRGILLSSKDAVYDNAKGELTITFEDEEVHGNVDGGHTYSIIKEHQKELTPGSQYVKLEILTGVEDIFTRLAAARNTSVQVQDKSIAELENRFEIIKSAIEKEDKIFPRIIYKQNADGDIDIADILSILNLFNIDEYRNDQFEYLPIQSYSSKSKCVDRYIKLHKKFGDGQLNPFVKMKPIIVDILKLYDQLEVKIGDYYTILIPGGKYGRIKGISGINGAGRFESKFYQNTMDYMTPNSFIYPILGAFRALVIEEENGYKWCRDPFTLMDKIGKELVSTTIDRSRTLGNNPNATGKDTGNWKTLYMITKMSLMNEQ